jgi:uncharacterized protein
MVFVLAFSHQQREYLMKIPRTSIAGICACFMALVGVARAADAEAPYKTKYRVIDVHAHFAVATDAAVKAEMETLDAVGIASVVCLDAEGPDGNLATWMKLREKYPGRLIVFWKPDFTKIKQPQFFANMVRDLERGAKMGIQGVKIWKDLGMYFRDGDDKLIKADDPRLDPFWAKCGELGIPVLIHAADPKEYWYPLTYNSLHYGLRDEKDQHYHNPDMPTWEELIRQRDNILKKHPKTMFIGAHMGSESFDLKQLGETFEKYPNFHTDCAARLRILGKVNPPAMRDFFTKYQNHLLFGSDEMVLFNGRKPSKSKNITVYPRDSSEYLFVDTNDLTAVKQWQGKSIKSLSLYLQYFETDRVDLTDPSRSGGSWQRIPGVKLPPEVLEKFYHANAERIIPGLRAPR